MAGSGFRHPEVGAIILSGPMFMTCGIQEKGQGDVAGLLLAVALINQMVPLGYPCS